MANDETTVLAEWGEGEPGPMNSASGQGLSDVIVELIGRLPDVQTVCDLGCGNGFLASRLAALGKDVVGVDASKRLLHVAQTHYASNGVRFQYGVFGDELAAGLAAGGSFDLAVSVDVIEHLYRPMSLIETASRIVRPGGRFVVCTPYHGYVKNLAISLVDGWDQHHSVHWDGGHVKFFSVKSLTKMINRRFTIERFAYYGRMPGLWKNMICVARRQQD